MLRGQGTKKGMAQGHSHSHKLAPYHLSIVSWLPEALRSMLLDVGMGFKYFQLFLTHYPTGHLQDCPVIKLGQVGAYQ